MHASAATELTALVLPVLTAWQNILVLVLRKLAAQLSCSRKCRVGFIDVRVPCPTTLELR